MRLDLAERLRCPRPHAATPLVVVASRVEGRELVSGDVGCPACRFEARVVGGDLELAASPGRDAGAARSAALPDLDRTVALLGLAEPGGAVLLLDEYARLAGAFAEALDLAVATVDGPAGTAVRGVEAALPFVDGAFRAVACGSTTPPPLAADAARCLAVGGRFIGPVALVPPSGVRVLAGDDREWVAEREAPATVVELRRRP